MLPAHAASQMEAPTATTGMTLRRLEKVQSSSGERLRQLQTHLDALTTEYDTKKDTIERSKARIKSLNKLRTTKWEPGLVEAKDKQKEWAKNAADAELEEIDGERRMDYITSECKLARTALEEEKAARQAELDAINGQGDASSDEQPAAAASAANADGDEWADARSGEEEEKKTSKKTKKSGGGFSWSNLFAVCTAPDQDDTVQKLEATLKDWERQLATIKADQVKIKKRHAQMLKTSQGWDSKVDYLSTKIEEAKVEVVELNDLIEKLPPDLPPLEKKIKACKKDVDSIQGAFDKVNGLHIKFQHAHALEEADKAKGAMESLKNRLENALADASWWKDTASSLEERMEHLELTKRQMESSVLNSQSQVFVLKEQIKTMQEQVTRAQMETRKMETQVEAMESQKAVMRELLKERVLRQEQSVQQAQRQHQLQHEVERLKMRLESSQTTIEALSKTKNVTMGEGAADKATPDMIEAIFREPSALDTSVLSAIGAGDDEKKTDGHIIGTEFGGEFGNTAPSLLGDSNDSFMANEDDALMLAGLPASPQRAGRSSNRPRSNSGSGVSVGSASVNSTTSSGSNKSEKVMALKQRMKDLEGKKKTITSRLNHQKSVDDQEKETSRVIMRNMQDEVRAAQNNLSNERMQHAETKQQMQLLEATNTAVEARCTRLEAKIIGARQELNTARLVLQRFLSLHEAGRNIFTGESYDKMLKDLLGDLVENEANLADANAEPISSAGGSDVFQEASEAMAKDRKKGAVDPQTKGIISTEA